MTTLLIVGSRCPGRSSSRRREAVVFELVAQLLLAQETLAAVLSPHPVILKQLPGRREGVLILFQVVFDPSPDGVFRIKVSLGGVPDGGGRVQPLLSPC